MSRSAPLALVFAAVLAPAAVWAQAPGAAPPSDEATRAAVRRAGSPASPRVGPEAGGTGAKAAAAPAAKSATTPAAKRAAKRAAKPAAPSGSRGAQRFVLTSADLTPGTPVGERHVFNGFGCSGQNVSPALAWRGAPEGTRSYAVTVYDPDAPTGSGWWHWVVYNIPASATALPSGAGAGATAGLPAGAAQGTTDFGTAGYGGPCPPAGDAPHRYVFTVHALKVARLDLPANATAAFVGFNLNANRLASASFTARYGR
jgi:Raf kinase inhibitor-like YbhB/YbcL family protein